MVKNVNIKEFLFYIYLFSELEGASDYLHTYLRPRGRTYIAVHRNKHSLDSNFTDICIFSLSDHKKVSCTIQVLTKKYTSTNKKNISQA